MGLSPLDICDASGKGRQASLLRAEALIARSLFSWPVCQMYLCYVDESGTSEIPGNTSHFVLAGLSLPISFWRSADREISLVLARYGLENDELHTAWVLRRYLEQTKLSALDRKLRRRYGTLSSSFRRSRKSGGVR